MTCVVGLVDNGVVYIGGDSAGVNDELDLKIRADEKVFKKDNFIFGFTSSFRMGQLLRYKLDIPKQASRQDDFEYMCTDFIEAVRMCLKEGGYATINNNEESGGTFLVGYNGNLYEIQDDFQVAKSLTPFNAIGSGARIALGSLYSTEGYSFLTPKDRINLALHAAQKFNAGVREPFHIITT